MSTAPVTPAPPAARPAEPRPGRLRRLAARIPPARRFPLAVYAATQAVLLVWWAAFYPALFSFDSYTYIFHSTTGHWASDHSVVYDAMVGGSLRLLGTLAPLTLLQTAAMAAALTRAAVAVRALGCRGRWCLAAAAAAVLLPSTGTFAVFVWKDVPFTIAAVAVFAAGTRLVGLKLAGTGRLSARTSLVRRQLVLLAAGFLGLGLFRNNGLLVALIAGIALTLVLAGVRRLLVLLTAAAVAVPAAAALAVYPALGVRTPSPSAVYAFNYADIAYAYRQKPWVFSAADQRLLASVAPLAHWRGRAANCWDADWTMAAPMNRAAADRVNDRLLAVWWTAFTRDPQDVLAARVCRASIAWMPWRGPAKYQGDTIIQRTDFRPAWRVGTYWSKSLEHSPYLPEMRSRGLVPHAWAAGSFAYYASQVRQVQWLLWRGALWCYVTYALVAVAAYRRRSPALLAVAAVTAAVQLTVLAANPAPLFRYMAAPMVLGLLCLPLAGAARGTGTEPNPWEKA